MSEKFVNRNGQPFSEELVKLARISPKSYAEKIRVRNQVLLDLLPDMVEGSGQKSVDLGCPHCSYYMLCWSDCQGCLWQRVYGSAMCCCRAEFPSGYRYCDVNSGCGVGVDYSDDCAMLTMYGADNPETRAKVKAFLEDHVDWAELECWGTEYVET